MLNMYIDTGVMTAHLQELFSYLSPLLLEDVGKNFNIESWEVAQFNLSDLMECTSVSNSRRLLFISFIFR